jgi:STE24 endopeptidase
MPTGRSIFIAAAAFATAFIALAQPALGADSEAVRKYFDDNYLQTASEYQTYGRVIFIAAGIFQVAFLLAAVFWFGRHIARITDKISRRIFIRAAVFTLLLVFLLEILLLPLWYISFLRGKAFGLVAMDFTTALARHGLGIAVSFVIVSLLAGALMYALVRWPRFWWLPAWAGFSIVCLLMVYIFPVVVSPLFNEFKPLPPGELREGALALAKKAGVEVGDVLVNDESAYTNYANAYFTGLGPTKRIVLYNTLTEPSKYARPEVFQIIAHEIGHWKSGHIIKGLALSIAAALAGLAAAAWLLNRVRKWKRIGMEDPKDLRVLPILALIIGAMAFLANPAENALSRSFERESDAAALELTGDPDTFISMEVKLTKQNLGDPDPPAFLQWYFGTHPATMERIAAAGKAKQIKPAEAKNE